VPIDKMVSGKNLPSMWACEGTGGEEKITYVLFV